VWHVRNGEIRRVGNKTQGYAVAVADIPLSHQADAALAVQVAGRVAEDVAQDDDFAADVLEPPQVLGVDKVTVEGITLRLTVKVNPGRQFAVQRALNAALVEAFDRAGVARPEPANGPTQGAATATSGKGTS
jgi:small conductance mechanosensitive channel